MGSPLGPSLAKLFMCALEQKFLDNCPSEFKPILYRRYVHDTFCIFRNTKSKLNRSFLYFLYLWHPNCQLVALHGIYLLPYTLYK